jgi:predicted lipoprotein with Yx(FWY)xxD motif
MKVWFVTKGLLLNDHAAAKPGEPASRLRPRRLGSMRRPVVALIALAAAGVLAAGCGGNSPGSGGGGIYGGGGSPTGTAPSGVATVAATSTKLGQILVDGNGRTLYLFQKDQPDQSACAGGCASAWPPGQSSGTPKAGSPVQASLLGTIKRSDGTTQVTYNHHPLYYYSGDSGAGQQNGQGLNAFGALWYVVAPSGEAVTSATS